MSLALFDYLRKSRSQGFVVSLSGGADSTGVSLPRRLRLVDFALADIGRERVWSRSSATSADWSRRETPKAIVRRLLGLRLSGDAQQRRRDARAPPARWPRRSARSSSSSTSIRSCRTTSAWSRSGIGRELDWKTDDLALQNIQARSRSPSVWLLANLRNGLLLATSNRSEAAVGYATMDGDTSGGLSPIAGIDKAFIRRWLRWMETHGPDGIGPLPALAAVNDQAPTAELRPPSAKQTDEDDLMPYELLDAIERAAIRDKQSPVEILLLMEAEFPQYTRPQLVTVDRAVLPPLVPQPVEARALRSQLSPRRREPRPQNLVPLPDPLRRLRARAGGAAEVSDEIGGHRAY